MQTLDGSKTYVRTVVIFSYSRADLLRDCIESVLGAAESELWKKVLIWQQGHEDVRKVVDEYKDNFDVFVVSKSQQKTTLGNINQNRVLGTSICFDSLNSDYVLGIEEDSMIGYDALVFIDQMYRRYRSVRAFRGINLGSLEELHLQALGDYSLIRFGLHGQAGVLTRSTWNKINMEKLLDNIDDEGWDSRIEYVTKSGFMVTPNASRLLDRGWVGTHAPTDSEHPYFAKMRLSWIGLDSFEIPKYRLRNVAHSWRKDSIVYRKSGSPFFTLRNTRLGLLAYLFWRKVGLPRIKFEN